MDRIAIVYFTQGGRALAERLSSALGCAMERPAAGQLMSTAARLFAECDALIFIGACGIAVRAIAPLVADKARDPAVVVLDERGRHAISLLSGHIGGANELARRLAGITGGEAVITTATDVNGRFSVDAWAARAGCHIDSMALARQFSAEILGRDLPLYSEFPVDGALPQGLYRAERGDIGVAITCSAECAPFDRTLRLMPRALCLGIGCRRGASREAIESGVRAALAAHGLSARAVGCAASIDVKRDEQGLIEFARAWELPLAFYSAQQLRDTPGSSAASAFVERTVGVDNVCERAALRAAGDGARLLVGKTTGAGMTVAVAQQDWRARFE